MQITVTFNLSQFLLEIRISLLVMSKYHGSLVRPLLFLMHVHMDMDLSVYIGMYIGIWI